METKAHESSTRQAALKHSTSRPLLQREVHHVPMLEETRCLMWHNQQGQSVQHFVFSVECVQLLGISASISRAQPKYCKRCEDIRPILFLMVVLHI